ncbi:DUF1801 domain-containing protein [Aequorivita xiaoshiensis]|uniref:DUF1801 domain-containing protein n=1 Tax=Aequorivita xiaoshiensis TaxID=2874476 RepID=A0A9X1U3F7_9FLAO|nr:DUF1801 domain-containing protein [Aequorivita xiaoshiensis]MCG2430694.1 DUF1801 domain-containing protein [Aequorivita xiaoshiensis]
MKLITNNEVEEVFQNYPEKVKQQMYSLRELVINTASNIKEIDKLEETLRWGEPSYITKFGSTLRIDWKPKTPNQYAIYFKCTSKLVPTFKTLYKNEFNFEGNRAICFKLDEEIPRDELKQCISMAMMYHKLKHLPLLGV